MTYPGGKNRTFRTIINHIPPCRRFVEVFGGSAAVTRHLGPVAESIVCELSVTQHARLTRELPRSRVYRLDALPLIEWQLAGRRPEPLLAWSDHHRDDSELATLPPELLEPWDETTVVYLDPPYPVDDRRSRRRMYRHELSDAQHARIIAALLAPRRGGPRILVSGQPWGRYATALATWRRTDIPVTLRSGAPGVDSLWASFPEPAELHTYRWAGADKRERQDLQRLVARTLAKLQRLTQAQRAAVLRAIHESFPRP